MEVGPGQFCFVVTFLGLDNSHFILLNVAVALSCIDLKKKGGKKKEEKEFKGYVFHKNVSSLKDSEGFASGVA